MEGAIVINLPCADTELCQGHSFRAIRILCYLDLKSIAHDIEITNLDEQ